jgi:hypothetical protein
MYRKNSSSAETSGLMPRRENQLKHDDIKVLKRAAVFSSVVRSRTRCHWSWYRSLDELVSVLVPQTIADSS